MVSAGLGIVAISNPEKTKVKVPIRLEPKLRKTLEPVVGMVYIVEYIPVSDAEMEPHYECELCPGQVQANCINLKWLKLIFETCRTIFVFISMLKIRCL